MQFVLLFLAVESMSTIGEKIFTNIAQLSIYLYSQYIYLIMTLDKLKFSISKTRSF